MTEKVEEMKKLGDEEFKEGNFFSAITHYTEALLYGKTPQLYSNRAVCYIKMKKYEEAIEDADQALEIDPLFLKGYYRKCNSL